MPVVFNAMYTYQCGHPTAAANTSSYVSRSGSRAGRVVRRCLVCHNAKQAERRRQRRREQGAGPPAVERTHCPQGHPYDDENTYIAPNGDRQCKTCRRAHRRASYARHREVRAADNAAWYARNRAYAADRHREWRKANPERANLISRLKKQRRRAAGDLTAADWQAVLDAYGADCLACGSNDPPTIDHVIPISKGGTNTVDNVQPLCSDCNTKKGTKTIDYRPGAAVV